jgi:hypothetical protein
MILADSSGGFLWALRDITIDEENRICSPESVLGVITEV